MIGGAKLWHADPGLGGGAHDAGAGWDADGDAVHGQVDDGADLTAGVPMSRSG